MTIESIDSRYYITHSEVKASVIKRFNRTLKARMWRYFTENNTYRYVDVLQGMVTSYNASPHRSLKGQSPDSVGPHNQLCVWEEALSTKKKHKRPAFKYKVGDQVRISRNKGPFEKGYTDTWSEEYFLISRHLDRVPPMSVLKDLQDEELKGVFYEPEL